MAVITDLSWQQVKNGLIELGYGSWITAVGGSGNPYVLRIELPLPNTVSATDIVDKGVVFVLSKLLEAARIAQEQANVGQSAGERLNAFPAPTESTPAAGLIPVTRSIAGRVVAGSATSVIGPTV